jgi:hypothetical protein
MMERIYHRWDKWECYKNGFFTGSGHKQEYYDICYVNLLTDLKLFEAVLEKVTTMWPYSCEHNLSNESMNRIAWLGQASCAYLYGARADSTRSNFSKLSEHQQIEANKLAEKYLNLWLVKNEKTT